MDLFAINPLLLADRLLAYARHGVGVKFGFTGGSGPNNAAIKTLRQYGIKVYGFGMTSKERSFRVRKEQAQWAEFLLLCAGSPMSTRPGYPENADVQPGPMPLAWGVPARAVGIAGAFGGKVTDPTTRREQRTQRRTKRQRRGR